MTSPVLAGLNAAQQKAVQIVHGPALVLAGPGSGKTGVLVRRVAYLADQVGIPLDQILAVTFTNKAAREMRERIDGLLGAGRASALTAGTFHSLCARFLRRDIIHLGRERSFVIYDSDDQLQLMKRVLKDLNLEEKKNPPRAIHGAISSAKNELVGVEEYRTHARGHFEEIVSRCYARYQELLRSANALDFDDLLVETVRLFEQHPEVLNRYQERYRYILADEYQDTNRVQYVLLKLLAGKYRNLFVVGDEDQGIYAFRGADIRNIRSFEKDYPEAQIVLLEQNYRSTQSILDVAQAVINRSNKRMRDKHLWTENDKGALVSLQEAYDENEEARLVGSEAARLVSSGEFKLNDVAIMYRTNAQSRAIEDALRTMNLPYQLVGGTRFYDRKEVKDTLAYLRVLYNPFDSISMLRMMNWPGRGIGQRTVDELIRWANGQNLPLYTALQLLADDSPLAAPTPFTARTRTTLIGFLHLLDELMAARDDKDLLGLFDTLFTKVSIEDALIREYGEEEGRERWENVVELQNIGSTYQNLPRENQLSAMLEDTALMSDLDGLKEEGNTITCITLHQAKGLEYPVVFLVGLEEGLLPHSRSLDDSEALDEERRLFYVGATRAKRRLYMLYSFRRTTYGRTGVSQSSRFLTDIPKQMLHQMPKRGYANVEQSSMFSSRERMSDFGRRPISRPAPQSSMPQQQRAPLDSASRGAAFAPGQKVRHATFGDGVVVSTKLVEDDEEVTVAFAGKGVKRLLASFARLETAD